MQDNRGSNFIRSKLGRQQTAYRKRWALVIGINDYGGHHRPLRNAGNDAREFAKLLRFYGYECRELYHEQATKESILGFLRDTLPGERKVKDEDSVVIFFSGHGVSQEGKRGYLVPYGARASYADYISMGELREACSTLAARHILIILDCCFSGLAAMRGSREPAAPTMSKDPQYVRKMLSRPAWQLITAGDVDEPVADSGRNPNHSAFTYYLLQGLSGGADVQGDGLITGRELEHYLYSKVYEETKNTPAPQIPFMSYINPDSERGDFVFHLPKNIVYPWVEDVAPPTGSGSLQLPTFPPWMRSWQVIAPIVFLLVLTLALLVDFDGDSEPNYQELAGLFAPPPTPTMTLTPAPTSSPQANTATPDLELTRQASDLDGDGLTMEDERALGTDPNKEDTDEDGLNDYLEARRYGTNPIRQDTDGDRLLDGQEVNDNTDPNDADTDGDGVDDRRDPEPLTPDAATEQPEATETIRPAATSTAPPAPTSTAFPTPAPQEPSVPTQPQETYIRVESLSPPSGTTVTPGDTFVEIGISYALSRADWNAAIVADAVLFESPDCTYGGPWDVQPTLADQNGGILTHNSTGTRSVTKLISSELIERGPSNTRAVSFLIRLYQEGVDDVQAEDTAYSTRCYPLP